MSYSDSMLQSQITEITLRTITEIEELAEEIISDRAQIIDFDKKRCGNRQALRETKVNPKDKQWICIGNLFLKISQKQAIEMLKNDQNQIEKEIANVHNGLKPKLKKLHELEGLPSTDGFDLKSIKVDA
ncbi:p53 and DNA damage-regulated protein 1 [Hydra vulgaris]|uniref:p53 and DNA damage-regulated protein 1 n=1 Tax=Hydra vulgaris TaxID=6087 RepID=UPI00019270DB|nr:p53 and DNA damage-regulated protein 1-like [Hydra vulgaris]